MSTLPPGEGNLPADPFPMHTRPRRPLIPWSAQFALLTAAVVFALLVACASKDRHPANAGASSQPDNSLITGDIAPDFTLENAHGGTITLSQLTAKQPVILIFYLGYSCPHCVRHLRDLANRYAEFQKAGAQILAISPDSIAQSQDSIGEFGNFPFPILSDPGQKLAARYGLVLGENVLFHGAFVIDTQRKIRFEIRSDHPYNNADNLLAELDRLHNLPKP